MRDFIQGKSFKTLVTVVIVILFIMLVSVASGSSQNIFSSAISLITAPIQRLTAVMTGAADETEAIFDNPVELRAEIEGYKEKIRELTSSLVEYQATMQENERLREILGIKEEHEGYEFLSATVISRDTSDSYHSFIIDRGSADGVALHDPVVTVDGLVGYVTELGTLSSKVTTILDPSIDLGAFDRRSRDGGVITGTASLAVNGNTKLGMLQRDYDIVVGDIIVTSGLGGIFPKDYIIGEVIDVKPETQSISIYAVVKPAADIIGCTDVLVITEFDGQGLVVDGELVGGTSSDSGDGDAEE